MKSVLFSFLLLFWMVTSIILVCTLIGIILLYTGDEDDGDITPWMQIGKELISKI